MSIESLLVGDLVKVLSARHPDVFQGAQGRVEVNHEGGFGVSLEGSWMLAGSDRGECVRGTRTVWFPPEELELVYRDTGPITNAKPGPETL